MVSAQAQLLSVNQRIVCVPIVMLMSALAFPHMEYPVWLICKKLPISDSQLVPVLVKNINLSGKHFLDTTPDHVPTR